MATGGVIGEGADAVDEASDEGRAEDSYRAGELCELGGLSSVLNSMLSVLSMRRGDGNVL